MNLEFCVVGRMDRESSRADVVQVAGEAELDRVTEHRIRLRGGWECRPAGSPKRMPERLTCRSAGDRAIRGRMVLTRRFGRPPLEPRRHVCFCKWIR